MNNPLLHGDAWSWEGCGLDELCARCALDPQFITLCVEEGIVQVSHDDSREWTFTAASVLRIRKAWRLHRDLDVRVESLGLVLELLEERGMLEAEITRLRRRLAQWEPERDRMRRDRGWERDGTGGRRPEWCACRRELAGVAGFEPTHDGIRIRCLTAWRHPNGRVLILYQSPRSCHGSGNAFTYCRPRRQSRFRHGDVGATTRPGSGRISKQHRSSVHSKSKPVVLRVMSRIRVLRRCSS